MYQEGASSLILSPLHVPDSHTTRSYPLCRVLPRIGCVVLSVFCTLIELSTSRFSLSDDSNDDLGVQRTAPNSLSSLRSDLKNSTHSYGFRSFSPPCRCGTVQVDITDHGVRLLTNSCSPCHKSHRHRSMSELKMS